MHDIDIKIDCVFRELGFEIVKLGDVKMFRYKESYYKMTYIEDFRCYVIEYANNYKDAQNNVFEDGDTYSANFGEDQFLECLKKDLIKYYCQ